MQKIVDGVYVDERGHYYVNGVYVGTTRDLSKYLYVGIRREYLVQDISRGYQKRCFIDAVNREFNCNIEDIIPTDILSKWLKSIIFYDDFRYLCMNYNKLSNGEVYWFFGRGFNTWKDLRKSLNFGSVKEAIEELEKRSVISIIQKEGYISGRKRTSKREREIVCPLGVFPSIEVFCSSTNISRHVYNTFKAVFGEKDFLEKLVLGISVRDRLNLDTVPMSLVPYKGEFYPNVAYVAEMEGVVATSVRSAMGKGESLEEAIDGLKNRKTRKLDELYDFYKSREDTISKVEIIDGKIIITVEGESYSTQKHLCEAYKVSPKAFITRLNEGWTIGKALKKGVQSVGEGISFSFLGKGYLSYEAFCREYKIPTQMWRGLTEKYSLEELEEKFKWLNRLIKKSGVKRFNEMGYLFHIDRVFKGFEEEIVYQIKHHHELNEGDVFYLGGKSYKRLVDFMEDANMNRNSRLVKTFKKERVPYCIVADMIFGNREIELYDGCPETYILLFIREETEIPFSFFNDDRMSKYVSLIRESLKKGETKSDILESFQESDMFIKAVLGSEGYNHFVRKNLDGVVCKSSLISFFNGENIIVIKKFLENSNVELVSKSYTVSDDRYFLCIVGGEPEYLSGKELYEISLKSVLKVDTREES